MESVFRKLQKISGSFFVSLPKKWIENFNLQSKSPVRIDIRSDGVLIISPKIISEDVSVNDELILHPSPYVPREIVKHCLSGQTNVVLISDKEIDKSLKNEIRWLVKGLPNTEIIEDQRQRIVIQNFGYKKIPTKKLIQRQLYLIADMFDDILDKRYNELDDNYEQLKRFYFILVTHIRTYLRTGVYVSEDSDFTPLEAMDLRMFCGKISNIANILKDLRIEEKILEFFQAIQQYFDEVMNAYLKNDLELAHISWLKKDNLVDKNYSLISKLNYDEKEIFMDLIRIAKLCKDMAAFI
ncbi:MAG: AbrB/MazE/SpoVT family DNA-binding domain-containing protein [Candidatus Hermodarchaeota archaeon]